MIPNPWVLLGVAIAWAWSLFAVGSWQREEGATKERVTWQQRDRAELAAANSKILELQEAAKREHRQHEISLAAIGTDLSKERTAHEALRRSDRERALAGDLRLRDPGATARQGACERRADGAPAAAGGGDGPAPGELSRTATAFLFELVDDADEVAKQLTACQRVIESDRAAAR